MALALAAGFLKSFFLTGLAFIAFISAASKRPLKPGMLGFRDAGEGAPGVANGRGRLAVSSGEQLKCVPVIHA